MQAHPMDRPASEDPSVSDDDLEQRAFDDVFEIPNGSKVVTLFNPVEDSETVEALRELVQQLSSQVRGQCYSLVLIP